MQGTRRLQRLWCALKGVAEEERFLWVPAHRGRHTQTWKQKRSHLWLRSRQRHWHRNHQVLSAFEVVVVAAEAEDLGAQLADHKLPKGPGAADQLSPPPRQVPPHSRSALNAKRLETRHNFFCAMGFLKTEKNVTRDTTPIAWDLTPSLRASGFAPHVVQKEQKSSKIQAEAVEPVHAVPQLEPWALKREQHIAASATRSVIKRSLCIALSAAAVLDNTPTAVVFSTFQKVVSFIVLLTKAWHLPRQS
mmetsp:Transcript_140347/g.261682  ORF Transcript_140347/g.261682 Transcript_140347/m.261682 type:complete len:248 (+) Transcript_140347:678-1421(+)